MFCPNLTLTYNFADKRLGGVTMSFNNSHSTDKRARG